MPRKPRVLTEAGVYHVITRGNNRQDLFRREADYQTYLNLFEQMKKTYRFHLYHYCLMTNHTHLLMRFFDAEGFQKVMQRVNLIYARHYKKLYDSLGHVFHDRFKSLPIENDSYLLECGRYIERNPLKAGLAKDPCAYPWSSYAFYAEGRPNSLLTANPLYLDLGFSPEERRRQYREYVTSERAYEKLSSEPLLPGTVLSE